MPTSRSVPLNIAGHQLVLRTDKDEAQLGELVEYVESVITTLKRNARGVSSNQLFLMTALIIADELLATSGRTEALKREVQERTARAIELLESSTQHRKV